MVRLWTWPINDETIQDQTWTHPIQNTFSFLCLPYYISTSFVPTVSRQQQIRAFEASLEGLKKVWFQSGLRITAFFFCNPFSFLTNNILISWYMGEAFASQGIEQWAGAPETAYNSFFICIFNLLGWIWWLFRIKDFCRECVYMCMSHKREWWRCWRGNASDITSQSRRRHCTILWAFSDPKFVSLHLGFASFSRMMMMDCPFRELALTTFRIQIGRLLACKWLNMSRSNIAEDKYGPWWERVSI